jgi:hypothetical protein
VARASREVAVTVQQQTPFNSYTGNGVTTVFPYQFKILAAADLTVYAAGILKVLNVDYTVTGVGVDVGGSVTFISGAPAAGAKVAIVRAGKRQRLTDYQQQGDFNTPTVNPDFDNAILLIQDLGAQLGRTLTLPADELDTLPSLPAKAVRSGKYIAFDANGLPISSAGTGNDAALRTDLASTLSGADGARLVGFKRTETGAAGATVAAILAGCLLTPQMFGAVGDGAADDTTAIKNAFAASVASGVGLFLPAATYRVIDTCIAITLATQRVQVRGVPLRTRILNQAPANKATIDIQGGVYWDIQGLVLIGATGFPNKGIYLHKDGGSNRCAYFNIQDIVCQTNGVGIHIQDTNSGWITNFQYWPSGGNSFGGSIDANSRVAGLLADGTSAVNSVHLRNFNISGMNTTAADPTAAAIKLDGTTAGAPFQDWTIESAEAENPGCRALWLRNCNNVKVSNFFHENTELRIDTGSVRNVFICVSAAASGTVVISSAGGASRQNVFIGCQAASIQVNAACSENVYIGCNYAIAPGLSDATQVVTLASETTGSVLVPDRINMVWITPAFSAGDYTSNVGSWTVAAGDVDVCQYLVIDKVMTFNMDLNTTTVAGTPGNLRRVIPGGFLAAKNGYYPVIATQDNGATTIVAVARTIAGTATIVFQRDLAGTAWTNTADLTGVHCQLRFEIQ